jgi:hypothetical protein
MCFVAQSRDKQIALDNAMVAKITSIRFADVSLVSWEELGPTDVLEPNNAHAA